jgi:hypothetical protein
MGLKLEALFTLQQPTPAMLRRIKERVEQVLAEEGATGASLSLDFGVTEFLLER